MTTSKPEKKQDNSYGDYWSGKKPYLIHDYRKMMQKETQEEYYFHELNEDPMSELYRPYLYPEELEGFGWEYMRPPGLSIPEPPGGWPLPGSECQLACNPSMLDCRGGCTKIACICPYYGLKAAIKYDPTAGRMKIGKITHTTIEVCLDGEYTAGGEYDYAIIKVIDGDGRSQLVNVALVDCLQCCSGIGLSGDSTINPGSTWEGTISPACEGAKASVSSNSGCSFSAIVSPDGTTVYVPTGSNDCGAFTVTVADDDEDCGNSASATVRINNTGQGGEWTKIDENVQSQTCRVDCGGDPLRTCGTTYGQNCISDDLRLGYPTNPAANASCYCCYACESCSPSSTAPEIGCVTMCSDCTPTKYCGSCTGQLRGIYWNWGLFRWECEC